MEEKQLARDLIDFIDKSPCSYYSVKNTVDLLEDKGFKEYKLKDSLSLKEGDKGYFVVNGSGILAFNIGSKAIEDHGFSIVGSHTDSPGFRIKANPIMKKAGLIKLNTEVYGGPIFSTWLDRVLSLAGRVSIKSSKSLEPETKLINIDKDLLIIPNLAIHMNREVNKDFSYNPQNHLLPIMALASNEKVDENYLIKLLASELAINEDQILDYDLYLYDRQKGSLLGANEEFISVGRQDNLSMLYSSLRAFVEGNPKGVNILLATDNEEVGSRSIQGADSPMLGDLLERISLGLGKTREEYLRALAQSFLISSDMAHALHPNFEEVADPTNRPILGAGPVIKYAANKSYTSDAFSAAVFKNLCDLANVKCQDFHNRSDKAGGSTIGPISETHLSIKAVDIGGPMFAMHSIRELGAVSDLLDFYKVVKVFYSL
ncbi:MAG: M18 family aminopeptidase [Bacillota bacterium]|nr:M18 family aminopeptidase [Bacillota bacterium]